MIWEKGRNSKKTTFEICKEKERKIREKESVGE